jgi:hypothetical protein
MEPPIPALLFALLLLIGMQLLLEIGRRYGVRRRPKESESERGGLSDSNTANGLHLSECIHRAKTAPSTVPSLGKPYLPTIELRLIRTPHIDKMPSDVAIAGGTDRRAQSV